MCGQPDDSKNRHMCHDFYYRPPPLGEQMFSFSEEDNWIYRPFGR